MRKTLVLLSVLAMAAFVFGCAITDYNGFSGHNTQSEAKLWGKEVAFSGFGPDDGTYSYTVKYDNRGGQGVATINSYRNPVVGSFKRDGQIDVDGDDVQGSSGILGGKFLPYFKAVDAAPGCQFFTNITFDKSPGGASVALCILGAVEEVDKDLDLQANFSSVGDLLKQVWSGALGSSFSAEITQVWINGAAVNVEPFSIGAAATAYRPARFSLDGSQPSGAGFIQAILDNTDHMAPANIGFTFAGGMTVNAPAGLKVAFNHDALWSILSQ